MKKVCFCSLSICFLIVITTLLCSCTVISPKEYYSKTDNYISVTGIVSYLQYSSDALYIGLNDMSVAVDDSCFKIVGKSLETVLNNKIDEKLLVGDEVTLVIAPYYFGDGYVIPIVAVSLDSEILLDFEDGFNHLQDWLSE